MNEKDPGNNKSPHAAYKDLADDVVALKILEIIEKNPDITQRKIKSQTGLAAGLVPSFMKRVINKGWVRAKKVSPKRWLYYLTPEGFIARSRLTANYLSRTFSEYRKAQGLVHGYLARCLDNGWTKLIVAGTNELAEVTALNVESIDEFDLVAIVGESGEITEINGRAVDPFELVLEIEHDRVLVCDVGFLKWWRRRNGDIESDSLIQMTGLPPAT